MTRRAEQMSADDRRDQVLGVAEVMFAEHGYHHVSMDDLADRADVSKPVLYRHFPSKLDLYLAVIDRRGEVLLAEVENALAQAPSAGSGLDFAQAVISAFVSGIGVRRYIR